MPPPSDAPQLLGIRTRPDDVHPVQLRLRFAWRYVAEGLPAPWRLRPDGRLRPNTPNLNRAARCRGGNLRSIARAGGAGLPVATRNLGLAGRLTRSVRAGATMAV